MICEASDCPATECTIARLEKENGFLASTLFFTSKFENEEIVRLTEKRDKLQDIVDSIPCHCHSPNQDLRNNCPRCSYVD
jgi:hypothetical protein